MNLNRKVIIFGAGKNGARVMKQLGESNVCFFCDNFKAGEIFNQKRVIDFSELKSISQKSDYSIILSTDVKAMREQLEQAKFQYWEYVGRVNNFFNNEDVKSALDEELYNQYSNLENYKGKLVRDKNWYRVSYISNRNEQLVEAMKNKESAVISQILSSTYDGDKETLFEDEYFENRPGMRLIARLIRKDKQSKIKVCDLACGNGEFLREISSKRINCYGIDVSVERCLRLNLEGIECKVGNLEQCEYESEFFDYVTMMECLEHVSDPFVAMKEAYRILKDQGGKIFVTVPYGENCDSSMHVRQFYEDDLFSVAMKCGYKDIKIMRLPYINRTYKDNLFMSATKH